MKMPLKPYSKSDSPETKHSEIHTNCHVKKLMNTLRVIILNRQI